MHLGLYLALPEFSTLRDWTSELKLPLASWIRGVKTKEVLDDCKHSLTCHYYELPRSDNCPHPNL